MAYQDQTREQIRSQVLRIINTSDSADEIRQRIKAELAYPYAIYDVAIGFVERGDARVWMLGPDEKALTV